MQWWGTDGHREIGDGETDPRDCEIRILGDVGQEHVEDHGT